MSDKRTITTGNELLLEILRVFHQNATMPGVMTLSRVYASIASRCAWPARWDRPAWQDVPEELADRLESTEPFWRVMVRWALEHLEKRRHIVALAPGEYALTQEGRWSLPRPAAGAASGPGLAPGAAPAAGPCRR